MGDEAHGTAVEGDSPDACPASHAGFGHDYDFHSDFPLLRSETFSTKNKVVGTTLFVPIG
jgi:hypothetical protein